MVKGFALMYPWWGYKRLAVVMRRAGVGVSNRFVYRVLREAGLLQRPKPRSAELYQAAKLFELLPQKVNDLWQADVTYIHIPGFGWWYAVTVIDYFSRYLLAIHLAENNNAAALLIACTVLGAPGGVVLSHGQMVEIGDGFRVATMAAAGGCRIVGVGSTNRTHLADYEAALDPARGAPASAILWVHLSNFEQHGYVAEVELSALAALARARGVPLIADVGSGSLGGNLPGREPTVAAYLEAGADVVLASGDKLLGGPQAGVVVGGVVATGVVVSGVVVAGLVVDVVVGARTLRDDVAHSPGERRRDHEADGEVDEVAPGRERLELFEQVLHVRQPRRRAPGGQRPSWYTVAT